MHKKLKLQIEKFGNPVFSMEMEGLSTGVLSQILKACYPVMLELFQGTETEMKTMFYDTKLDGSENGNSDDKKISES
jgi:hypothetical protein